jgi:hypothetical protein
MRSFKATIPTVAVRAPAHTCVVLILVRIEKLLEKFFFSATKHADQYSHNPDCKLIRSNYKLLISIKLHDKNNIFDGFFSN